MMESVFDKQLGNIIPILYRSHILALGEDTYEI